MFVTKEQLTPTNAAASVFGSKVHKNKRNSGFSADSNKIPFQ
jgi:hypothetical protein